MRRGSIVAVLGIGLVAGGVAAAVALLLPWLPVDASRQGGRIDFVFWFVIAICIALFSIVAAVMIYSVLRFRVRPDDLEDGPPVHGHTGLEIAWTAIPFVLVTAIAIVSGIVLSRNDAQGANTLRINVQAQQFEWTFSYPDANNATSPDLYLPEGRSIELYMRSLDVIHAFFVPQFRLNQDIVPGMVTQLHVTPDRLGKYPLICNELCGLGHSLMRTWAVVVTPAAFDKWVAQLKKTAPPPTSGGGTTTPTTTAGGGSGAISQTAAIALFNSAGCSGCHTLSVAKATGHIGPDLDNLVAYAQEAKQPLAAFVHESIVSPNAYIQPGNVCGGGPCPSSTMPQTFAQSLSSAQINGLVSLLVRSATHASKEG